MGTIKEARATLKYAKDAKFNTTVIKKIEAHIKSLQTDIYRSITEKASDKTYQHYQ